MISLLTDSCRSKPTPLSPLGLARIHRKLSRLARTANLNTFILVQTHTPQSLHQPSSLIIFAQSSTIELSENIASTETRVKIIQY